MLLIMTRPMKTLLAIAFLSLAVLSPAADRATLTGKVADAAGKPVEHATVMVYEAGAKIGYSIFCPTCYTDCGKHTLTDADGNFAIGGLSPDLVFTLIVIREGYAAAYIKKVNPDKGAAEPAVLNPRPPVEDVSKFVRGRVVDAQGKPVHDAVVEQQGVSFRNPAGQVSTRYGGPDGWIDQMAVTNEQGEFEIAYSKPAVRMILNVNARGKAPKLFTEPTGEDRKIMTVSDGATIQGRLVYNGKPVANAEIGVATHERAAGSTYGEVRIGTHEDGTFAITNIPAGRIWLVYPKMASLVDRGISADVVPCETKDDGQTVDLGDIVLTKAYSLRGKIVLSDDKPIPPDMHMTLGSDRGWDSQITAINQDGTFTFKALAKGVYSLIPAVKGYRLATGPGMEALVDRDRSDFVIRMEPGSNRP
jgi:uncharacterized GH25 family protein